jgi:hypothetical protein
VPAKQDLGGTAQFNSERRRSIRFWVSTALKRKKEKNNHNNNKQQQQQQQ